MDKSFRSLRVRFVAQPCSEGQQRIVVGVVGNLHEFPSSARSLRGARMEEVVPGDENALCKASEQGKLNVVKLLVSRGANVNARIWVENARGQEGEWRSPLIMARRGGHQAVVNFLIASGARE